MTAPLTLLCAFLPAGRAMALIKNMGGKVAKKYDLGVIELAPPGTVPNRPGLTFFDWTWVFDCHTEGKSRSHSPDLPCHTAPQTVGLWVRGGE